MLENSISKIDIVIPWVDGTDPEWVKEKNKYDPKAKRGYGNDASRFRDWDEMRYWFRGVETYMPWVNRIFFITCGHVPSWLDLDNPKLRVVRHEEYIPNKYLPTFNSNVIELNLFRIKDLSENFILFNDDLFAVDKVDPKMFFDRGLPCDMLLAKTLVNYDQNSDFYHMIFNDMGIINLHFKGFPDNLKHIGKWVNPAYGLKKSLKNLSKISNNRFSGYYNQHLPLAYKKSELVKIYNLEKKNIDRSCENRFRSPFDLSNWLFRYWRLTAGEFRPVDVDKIGQYYEFTSGPNAVNEICEAIRFHKKSIIVINDAGIDTEETFQKYKAQIGLAFEERFPNPCSFENLKEKGTCAVSE